ncbi:hypothetical protein [Pigmentiphaga daeguensis]|uniref:Uncharacterized protein n=1 Tax=Pigmentiphaga daeguensis TaxID=414049 RepID=A0ABP3ML53_9BURK
MIHTLICSIGGLMIVRDSTIKDIFLRQEEETAEKAERPIRAFAEPADVLHCATLFWCDAPYPGVLLCPGMVRATARRLHFSA